jgi:hypothetical protein
VKKQKSRIFRSENMVDAIISRISPKIAQTTGDSSSLVMSQSSVTTELAGKEPTITVLPISKGGTGSATAKDARNALSTINNYFPRFTGNLNDVKNTSILHCPANTPNAPVALASFVATFAEEFAFPNDATDAWQVFYAKNSSQWYVRGLNGGTWNTWRLLLPKITRGTGDPSGGNDGDIYLKYGA